SPNRTRVGRVARIHIDRHGPPQPGAASTPYTTIGLPRLPSRLANYRNLPPPRRLPAKIFTANLAEALAREACESLPDDQQARYFPNLADILHALKTRLFAWLVQRVPHDPVLELIALYARTLELKRPDRKATRPKNRINPKPRRQAVIVNPESPNIATSIAKGLFTPPGKIFKKRYCNVHAIYFDSRY
ncbi:MAG: hypothetical protein ACRERU_18825, partial [Methylococcales bacterium]